MAQGLFPFSEIGGRFIWPKTGLTPNLGSKHLSGTRFSSNSDIKTAAENWLNGQGRDFYQLGLNKLVFRPDKCINRFGDCVCGNVIGKNAS
ncbi:hypothetical protein AVEN_163218-1 [Araneus ventricosus]|uniref:Uncharacterized protein n=1 Tax=Araneus ventricosus TaxID=182803 RepID=A0A4Y2E874_ARAVE|nr:hypothetical protein AVEN_163218-1 [Araneus ventricosus]